jgi:hypothetical protein
LPDFVVYILFRECISFRMLEERVNKICHIASTNLY